MPVKNMPEKNVTDETKIKTLSVDERCCRAFATCARAAVEVKNLTKQEVRAFAELIAPDGEPLHLDPQGKPVRHCDRNEEGVEIAELVSQRFGNLFAGYMKRLSDEASQKKEALNKQKPMPAKKRNTNKRRQTAPSTPPKTQPPETETKAS